MATLFQRSDRRVIPNWRRFDRTSNSGELDSFRSKNENKHYSQINVLEDYIIDWRNNATLYHAGDLLSAYMANGLQEENSDVIDAASYIIENEQASLVQISCAKKILHLDNFQKLDTSISTINDFVVNSSREIIYGKINELKRTISNFPGDFVNYVELSRLYSIIGNKEKSIRQINLALYLSNSNRYVLRSAARLFAHYGELDTAHDILRKNSLIKVDPWVVAAEIGISMLRGKTSNHIKRGSDMIKSNQFTNLSITELASSIGTLELINGSVKSSRNLFSKSLLEPNSNSLAQAEWAFENGHLMQVDVHRNDVKFNYEAMALDLFSKNKWREAVNNIESWFLDMPFMKRPIYFGNYIAIHYLNDQRLAANFCHAGLVAHPNDVVLKNNLAYSLAQLNQTGEAQRYLDEAKSNTSADVTNKICMTATQGLIFYRKGFADAGRLYYQEAIEKSLQIKHYQLINLSVLNYAKEEILAKSDRIDGVMEFVHKLPPSPDNPEVELLKERVYKMYGQYKIDKILVHK